MRGHTHALFGLTTLAVANHVRPFIQPHPVKDVPVGMAVCAAAAILGALAPDIDAEDSTIKRELGIVGLVTSLGLALIGVKHRGLTHYAVTTILVIAVSYLIGSWLGWPDVGLAFGLGYLSHFLADGMTKWGVSLWPGRKIHLLPRPLRIRTGSFAEILVALAGALVLAQLLPAMVPPQWRLILNDFSEGKIFCPVTKGEQ
jgi:membrane-bound metal-dependent hydrolase YbcI (DUF457 family)